MEELSTESQNPAPHAFATRTGGTQTSYVDIKALNEKIQKESAFVDLLTMEMSKVIIGQQHMTEHWIIV